MRKYPQTSSSFYIGKKERSNQDFYNNKNTDFKLSHKQVHAKNSNDFQMFNKSREITRNKNVNTKNRPFSTLVQPRISKIDEIEEFNFDRPKKSEDVILNHQQLNNKKYNLVNQYQYFNEKRVGFIPPSTIFDEKLFDKEEDCSPILDEYLKKFNNMMSVCYGQADQKK